MRSCARRVRTNVVAHGVRSAQPGQLTDFRTALGSAVRRLGWLGQHRSHDGRRPRPDHVARAPRRRWRRLKPRLAGRAPEPRAAPAGALTPARPAGKLVRSCRPRPGRLGRGVATPVRSRHARRPGDASAGALSQHGPVALGQLNARSLPARRSLQSRSVTGRQRVRARPR